MGRILVVWRTHWHTLGVRERPGHVPGILLRLNALSTIHDFPALESQ